MRTEQVELTVLCLIHNEDSYLLQDRVKKDWNGYTLPGGHIEPGESIVDAVVREMKEETGLTIKAPRLCGVKQFPIEGGRYIVFLFETDQFEGKLVDSDVISKLFNNRIHKCFYIRFKITVNLLQSEQRQHRNLSNPAGALYSL